jgi:hypothetical protein
MNFSLFKRNITPWNPGYYPDVNTANATQQKCYQYIKKNVCVGRYVDIEGQDAYLYYMAQEFLSIITSSSSRITLKELFRGYENVIKLYSDEKPKVISYFYPGFFALNFKLGMNDEQIKEVLSSYISFCLKNKMAGATDLVIAMYIKFTDCDECDYVDPELLPIFARTDLKQSLTEIGKKHYSKVLEMARDILNADFTQNGINYLYKMYDFHYGSLKIDDYVGLSIFDPERDEQPYGAIIPAVKNLLIPSFNETKHIGFIKNLLREAENLARDESGLQRIGEGWVSETLLYQQLKRAFDDIEVVQHASPAFLGKQHYDVYFPEYKIAVEYQGDQHFKPIDYFGGEEAYALGQERDKKKRELSRKNGVTQIDVLPGYDLKDILQQITKNMKRPMTDSELSARLETAQKTKADTHFDKDLSKSARNINSKTNKIIDEDQLLTQKMNELLAKRSKSWYAGQDFLNEVSDAEAERMIAECHRISTLSKTDPAESNRQAKELFDSGYRAPAIYERMAINYHKLKDYDAELDLLLQAKVDYGFNFDERIKKLLKRS